MLTEKDMVSHRRLLIGEKCRDTREGDDFGGFEAGSSAGNIGGGNVSMLDASMAAIAFPGPQQQQQQQQHPPPQLQLADVGSTGFLPQVK